MPRFRAPGVSADMHCEICGFSDPWLDAEVWRVEDLAKFARLDGPDRCRGVTGLCVGTGHLFFYRGATAQNFASVAKGGHRKILTGSWQPLVSTLVYYR